MDTQQSKAPRPRSRVGIAERTTASGVVQYRGTAYDRTAGRQIRGPWTTSLAEAKSWRVDAMAGIAKGTVSADRGRTLQQVADDYVEQAKAGTILNRDGQSYKPSAARQIEQSFRLRIIPTLGAGTRIGDLKRKDVQRAVDRWSADHLSPSSVRNTLNGLRAVCRYAERRGEIAVNPCTSIELPRVKGRRDRVATTAEGLALLAALGATERPIYATAMLAGLRLGELRALRWCDIDLDRKLIHVCRSWDPVAGEVAPKSEAGTRSIPIVKALGGLLAAHRRSCPWSDNPDGLVLGHGERVPFHGGRVRRSALKRWAASGLEPIGLHDSRHTAASWWIGAGVNIKAIQTFMGHSSITVTMDRYGHLLPGDEAAAGELMDAYLARSAKAS